MKETELDIFVKDFAKAKVLADESTTLVPSSNSTEQRVDLAAETLFDEYWEMHLMDDPETSTILGDRRYDDRLTSYSLKCYEKRKVMYTEFLERANQLLQLAEEGSDTHFNVQLFISGLQFQINEILSGNHLFAVSNLYTPQIGLRFLLKYVKLNDTKSYWDLISRYRAFPQQIDEDIALMREGIRTNYTYHEKSLWKPADYKIDNVTESPFYKPFLNISSLVLNEEIDQIQANASDAVMNSVYPALKKLDDFIDNEYRANARPEIGVSTIPDGREFYRHQLSYYLTDGKATPEEIHQMGLAEVERIALEMDEVIHSLGLNMTRQEFSNKLRNDKSQFFSTGEEAVETYRHVIFDVIYPKLPELFKTIPKKKLTVESIPKDMNSGPRAYYLSASSDNSTPATFCLDTSVPENLPRYEVMTLSMHEGVPGHHLQVSYAMEQPNVPKFRKYRTFRSGAYTEGWALYSEYLGYEMGLYEDPYMRYGHLSEEIFRACRMVVDTGMHVFGWSRQKAIDYMMTYSATTRDNIEREVDRYITWPGQACAYKYGELKIKEQRKRTELALGPDFDIKEFHEVILKSSGPLELVEKQVDRYIQKVTEAKLDS